jgi:Zn-dependent peptidase ImmA (M78 family)
MKMDPRTVAKDQVNRFWSAVGVQPSHIAKQYPVTFRKLKQRIQKKLQLTVLELEPLTSRRVERLLQQHGLLKTETHSIETGDLDLAGALFAVSDAGIVFLRKQEPVRARRLFTLAHELGHYFVEVYIPYLDSGRAETSALFNRDAIGKVSRTPDGQLTADSFKEYKANQFAAELLMPHEMVIKLYEKAKKRRKRGLSEDTMVKLLVRTFRVSQKAAQVRIKDMGIRCD